jgi:hypothetical protein
MSKIIDIMNGQPLEEYSFNEDNAKQFLEYLLKYKIDSAEIDQNERWMLHHVIKFVENSSGVSAMEILNKEVV